MKPIAESLAGLPAGPLDEAVLKQHVWPLFSRVREFGPQEIYLANHSLGRPLDRTAEDIGAALDLWYSRLDGAWDEDGWPLAMDTFRALVAQIVGVSESTAIVPKTSAGQGLRAVLNSFSLARPVRVVATRGEFDSVDFILKTYAQLGRAEVTWVEPSAKVGGVDFYDADSIVGKIGPGVDLVVVSKVVFATGQVIEGTKTIVDAAHAHGARVLVDAYHAFGVIPLKMEADGIDFMIGGSYKYIRGGPGACWLAIHPRLLDSGMRTLDTGWFAKKSPFSYLRPEVPEFGGGGNAWLESTPPVLTLYQARAGLELLIAIGVERLREYSLGQLKVLRKALQEHGAPVQVPADPRQFGAFALVLSRQAKSDCERLKTLGVNTDHRGDAIRFGPDLLNSEAELREAARIAGSLFHGS